MNVIDRVQSAKHTLTGSGINKAVSKATSHEVIGPKKKHVDYIQNALETDNVSIPDTADMLFERSNNSSWVVVLKALVTFHHLMSNANERFIQYVASRSTTWNLHNFLDKGGVQGYDMSHAIRRYSAYLSEKAYTYRTMGYDFCRVSRGKDGGVLRNMECTKLLKALPAIQTQLDALITTEISSNDLTNGVVTAAFMALFKDLIRLFACYNDGIINLLEKYFEMKKVDCKSALEIYKRFLARMERVSEFLKVAENAGIDKGDIPDLAKAPNSLLEALESHYQYLEKGKAVSPPTHAITLPAFTVDHSSAEDGFNSSQEPQREYLQEQKRLLDKFEKKKKDEAVLRAQQQGIVPNPLTMPAKVQQNNFQQSTISTQQQSLMSTQQPLMTTTTSEPLYAEPQKNNRPSDDLLLMPSSNNMSFNNSTSSAFSNTSSMAFGASGSGNLFGPSPVNSRPVDFNSAFKTSNQSSSTPNLIDDILTPERPDRPVSNSQTVDDGRLSGDLNKGLERVAMSLDGLNINPGTLRANTQKGHQWAPQQPAVRTGGANFQMHSLARSTLPPAGFGSTSPVPMAGSMNAMSGPMGGPMYQQQFQQPMQTYGMQQPGMYGYPMMQPQGMYSSNVSFNQRNPMMNNDPFK